MTKWCQECFSDLIGAKLDCTDHEGNTPLSEAACGGHPEICLLLLKHGADVNKRSEQGRTPYGVRPSWIMKWYVRYY